MKIIYSLYIDIPDDEIDEQPPYKLDNVNKSLRTKWQFAKYAKYLEKSQTEYAQNCGAHYQLFGYSRDYQFFYNWLHIVQPTMSHYDILNFYKIYLFTDILSRDYDEILFLDFDVIPNTKENFFDKHDMSTICIADQGEKKYDIVPNHPLDNRSPLSKYWNTHAMCSAKEYDVPTGVFNTAIIGGNKTVATRLKYFDNFENVLNDMVRCKADEMYTPNIRAGFGFDNETVFGYRVQQNDVPITYLDESWHYKLEDRSPVAFEQAFQKAKLIHMMNKRFELYYEDIDNGK